MKVLWVCSLPEEVRLEAQISLVPGAAMSWILGHLPPPDGVELHLVCPVVGLRREKPFAYKGAVWHFVEKKRFEPLWGFRRVARKVKKIVDKVKPDVVHGWGGEVGCGLVATLVAARAVVSVQGLLGMLPGEGNFLRRRLEARAYRRAAVCFCESVTAQRALKRLYGVEGVVVPQPLREVFLAGGRRVAARGERELRFLFVGQAVARKGYDDVQRAFGRLVGRRVFTRRAKQDAPGSGRGTTWVELRGVAQDGRCVLLTMITGGRSASEVAEAMRTHDAFILPSYGDTGPTAIKEALALGLHVIAYDNTGPKELIEKYGGTLVKTGDVAALAVAMGAVRSFVAHCDGAAIRKDLSREVVWQKLLEAYRTV